MSILTINGGSSSIKFAVFFGPDLQRALSGRIERIGGEGNRFDRVSSGPKMRKFRRS